MTPTAKEFLFAECEISDEKTSINAVAIKFLTFWPERAKVWFFRAKAQFTIRGIVAEKTKYYYILAALDQDTANCIVDLLIQPPASDKYQAIKMRLLNTFTSDKARRADLLLEKAGLGDNTPSQYMDPMLAVWLLPLFIAFRWLKHLCSCTVTLVCKLPYTDVTISNVLLNVISLG